MPLRVYVVNAEVLKTRSFETKTGTTIFRIAAKTWNPTKKGQKPEEVFFNVLCFNPNEELKALKNGDRINIGSAENTVLGRLDTNPKQVMVPTDNRNAEGSPARYFEIKAFDNTIEVVEKADTTRSASAGAPAKPNLPITDHEGVDDDLPF